MTITSIGILLIVLCVLLWAIMAAMHQHTLQLESLKMQMQELLTPRQPDSSHAARPARISEPRDNVEHLLAHSAENPSLRRRQKSRS